MPVRKTAIILLLFLTLSDIYSLICLFNFVNNFKTNLKVLLLNLAKNNININKNPFVDRNKTPGK